MNAFRLFIVIAQIGIVWWIADGLSDFGIREGAINGASLAPAVVGIGVAWLFGKIAFGLWRRTRWADLDRQG